MTSHRPLSTVPFLFGSRKAARSSAGFAPGVSAHLRRCGAAQPARNGKPAPGPTGARASSRAVLLGLVLAWAVGCGQGTSLQDVREMHERREFAASVEPLRDYLELHPDDAEAYYLYGVALSADRRITEAMWPLRRAMEDPEWSTPAVLHLANISLMTTDWNMAGAMLDELLEREPDHQQAKLLRAYARAQSRQDYDGALEDADAVLAKDPASSDALVLRAVALLGLERIDEAGEAIEAAAEHFDDAGLGLAGSPRFCAVRGTFARERGEAEEAEVIFEECIERFPAHYEVVDSAARFFDSIGRVDRSIEIVQAAYETAPSSRNYRISLVSRLNVAGRSDEAEAILVEASKAPTPSVAAGNLADLAAFYFEQGRLDESIKAFEEVLTLVRSPGAAFIFAYADTLVAAGRYDRALEVADLIELPQQAAMVRGRVAYERGDYDEALGHFEEGLLLWPANSVARYLAGRSAEKLGDYDRAVEEYRYAVRAGSGETEARLRLARLYAAKGNHIEALEISRHNPDAAGTDALERSLFEIELISFLGFNDAFSDATRKRINSAEAWVRALVAQANGRRARAGAEASAQFLIGTDGLNVAAPVNAPALHHLMVDLVELGRARESIERIDGIIEAQPGIAAFHAIRGHAVALSAESPEDAREDFEAALALDPAEPVALRGLARLEAAAGNDDAAIDLYARAAEADERDVEALREAAALLARLGRNDEAAQRLEALLEREPFSGGDALVLAKLRLEADPGDASGQIAPLLRCAATFGDHPEADALLEGLAAGNGGDGSATASAP